MPVIVVGLLIGLPILLCVILRVNAALVFLALCAGSVAAQFVGGDAQQIFNSFFPNSSQISGSIVQITLILLPALLTILFMRRSITGSKSLFNLLPAIAAGLLTALLIVPELPPGTRYSISGTQAWSLITQFQSFIIALGVVLSLLLLWGTKSKHGKDKHKK